MAKIDRQSTTPQPDWKHHASTVIFPTLLELKAVATERLRKGIVVTGNVKLSKRQQA